MLIPKQQQRILRAGIEKLVLLVLLSITVTQAGFCIDKYLSNPMELTTSFARGDLETAPQLQMTVGHRTSKTCLDKLSHVPLKQSKRWYRDCIGAKALTQTAWDRKANQSYRSLSCLFETIL